MAERVMIFIDGSNLYHAVKEQFGSHQFDMERFMTQLANGRELVRCYFYTAIPPAELDLENFKRQQKFLNALSNIPYFDIKLGRLEKRQDTYVEKGVDVQIAVDMVAHCYDKNYDTAILVSADGDYSAVLEEIKRRGRHAEVAIVVGKRADALRRAADRIIYIDKAFIDACRLDRKSSKKAALG